MCVCVCVSDVDECEDPLLCPGQECVNSQGSYRCVSCQPGYQLINRLCAGNTPVECDKARSEVTERQMKYPQFLLEMNWKSPSVSYQLTLSLLIDQSFSL